MIMSVILILLLLFLLFRLWSVFGTHTGFDFADKKDHASFWNNRKSKRLKNVTEPVDEQSEFENDIVRILPTFHSTKFLNMCENCFLETIEAYKNAHYQILKRNLGSSVYESFAKQIDQREKDNLSIEFAVRNVKSKILNYAQDDQNLNIRVEISSEQMIATFNMDGESFDNPSRIFIPKINIWTFQRDINHNADVWIVVEMTEQSF